MTELLYSTSYEIFIKFISLTINFKYLDEIREEEGFRNKRQIFSKKLLYKNY